jgi:Ca2+-binding RTX toxin-like protein
MSITVTATDGQESVDYSFRIFPNSSGFVIDNYIAGATVFFDADRDGIIDTDEPFTTTDADGFYQLDIPDSFDLDGNGEFDSSEGRLVAFGGTALTEQIDNAEVLSNAPTDILLSNAAIRELRSIGTEVGILSSIDADTGETFSYTLVGGEGSTDNSQFEIVGDRLLAKAVFDYETKNNYSVRVQTSDGNGGVFQKQLNINILDLNEILGSPESETLTGTAFDDRIFGRQGSDTLNAEAGNDTLFGEGGFDKIAINELPEY